MDLDGVFADALVVHADLHKFFFSIVSGAASFGLTFSDPVERTGRVGRNFLFLASGKEAL